MKRNAKTEANRVIGIRHRIGTDKRGKKIPTMMAISTNSKIVCHKLQSETSELDFLLGRFPVEYRKVGDTDDLSEFLQHQLKTRKIKSAEVGKIDERLLVQKPDGTHVITHVPVKFDGLKKGDAVAMVLGGSGDRFAFALSNRGKEIGAIVLRIPSFFLKEHRGKASKDDDHKMIVRIAKEFPELFYSVNQRDRDIILVVETFRNRQDAQKGRIACNQRFRQRFIGGIFLDDEGHYPDGRLEDIFDEQRANNTILQAVIKEEANAEEKLHEAVKALDIYRDLFVPIKGCGPRIAAGIIASIGDIRRFETAAKLKAYLGVHVCSGGKYKDVPKEQQFPRMRKGKVLGYKKVARQSLYLLADQFNRRSKTKWGNKLLENKRKFREIHPKAIQIYVPDPDNPGQKKRVWRYNNGHIHEMAIWRTLSQFVVWLHKEWWAIEKRYQEEEKAVA